ncbi:MAG TPA: hypothetical protein VLX92_29750 [Kofleriaceae bacterium]|nr:hypothetical protein [Kofleriaceae bacterium]
MTRLRASVALLVVAACHHGNPATPDASGGQDATAVDAAQDATTDSAGCVSCGAITVTVYGGVIVGRSGTLLANIPVYFVWPDQTTHEVTTGSDGVATAVAPDDTEVVIVYEQSSTAYAFDVYEGLLVGDSFVEGDPDPPGSGTVQATPYFTCPAWNDATTCIVRASCTGGTQGPPGAGLPADALGCAQFDAANAVAYATDSQGNMGYASLTGIDYATANGAANPVVFPAFQPAGTLGVTVTGLPAAGNKDLELDGRYTIGSDPTILGSIDVSGGGASTTQSVTGAIPPFGDHTSILAHVTLESTSYSRIDYTQHLAQLVTTAPIDATQMVHPAFDSHWDSVKAVVSWLEDTAIGTDPTTVTASIAWMTSNGYSVGMAIYAPHSTTSSIAIPKLPADYSQMATPLQVLVQQVTLQSFVGKTYHDGLVGQTGDAPLWETYP